MARQLGNQIENAFTKGLITEATGLNFPENACTETLNCRFDQKGLVTRRLGFDYEAHYATLARDRDKGAMTEYVWESVAGTGTLNFAVIQCGRYLKFYKIDTDGALSPGIKSFTTDLNDFKVSGAPNIKGIQAQFATGKGYLFVAHPYCNPFYIEYNIAADTLTTTAITVKIRDFEGIEDNLAISKRPTTISPEHKYNLWNQGWWDYVNVERHGSARYDPIWNVVAVSGTYPSNADIWWVWKDELEAFQPDWFMNSVSLGNTPAPKGHYILEAFYQDRSAQEGGVYHGTPAAGYTNISGLTVVSSGYYRPKTIAFYAGRLWYAGVDATKFSSNVYYSQILDDVKKVGYCYQEEDPTAETLSDLLDTDGGVIDILEIGNVYKLFAMSSGLLVFASNGVWVISGQQGDSFKATDFSIRKVDSIPCVSATSFVDAQGTPIWWNLDGIYTVSAATDINKGQIGNVAVQSITDTTIKQYFDAIPASSKRYAKGAFNPQSKEIQWLFNSSAVDTTDAIAVYNYTDVLVLNTLTGAFYPWEIDITAGVKLNGILSAPGESQVLESTSVVDESAVLVVDASAVQVVVSAVVEKEFSASFRYLVSKVSSGTTYNFTFAQEIDTGYTDWDTPGTDVAYDSYLVTGFKVPGEAQKFAQVDYIVVFTETITSGSCFLQLLWDYASNTTSNRWGRMNQVYPARANYSVQQARIMPRGSGRACQLKFTSDGDDPFKLIGWSLALSTNAQP